jgi:predicted ATPase with chaperone activity
MQTLRTSVAPAQINRRIVPDVPENLAQLGLPEGMLFDLALRFLRERGSGSLTALRKGLKISFGVAEEIFHQLRRQQFIDVKNSVGQDFMFALTTAGRELAAEKSSVCLYAGPVPVPLDQYSRVIQSQRPALRPTEGELREAFSDLVLSSQTVNELGVALTSGRPVFLYGPSGNGKTSIIERLSRLMNDTVLVPYCVEVDGHIISVFDPATHIPLTSDPDELVDQRWVRCHRPTVIAGGELVAESISLQLDRSTGLYGAPLQMKAANGVFAIDDFGRQSMSPKELFNRWIMPLDRRIDHLSLQYGHIFRLPFELVLVFSTNLNPADLADEAFYRRVPNKVYLAPTTPEAFDAITFQVLARHGVIASDSLADSLRELCLSSGARELRACYPGDICNILRAISAYERRPFSVSPEKLSEAAHIYFTQV